jgi:hypothetical protein
MILDKLLIGDETWVKWDDIKDKVIEVWQPIETCPSNELVLLANSVSVWVGSFRFGSDLDEPQPSFKAWRTSCCGRFSSPTRWYPLLELPKE